jgi:hypothetical protein
MKMPPGDSPDFFFEEFSGIVSVDASDEGGGRRRITASFLSSFSLIYL